MTLLFDTNVLLDVFLDRRPHAEAASRALALVEIGTVSGLVGATTVTTLHYLATKAVGKLRATRHVRMILSLFDVAPVNRAVLDEALDARFSDYEDAVLHAAARHAGADGIVTRDREGFSAARMPVYSPSEVLAALRTAAGAD